MFLSGVFQQYYLVSGVFQQYYLISLLYRAFKGFNRDSLEESQRVEAYSLHVTGYGLGKKNIKKSSMKGEEVLNFC